MNKKRNQIRVLLPALAMTLSAVILTVTASGVEVAFTPCITCPHHDALRAEQEVHGSSMPVLGGVLPQSDDAGEDYLKRIVFLGDSTTYHMIARGVLPDGTATKQVWGPRNGTLMLSPAINTLKIVYPETNAEMTIRDALQKKQPEYMIITVGLNGSHSFSEALYKGSYRKLIDTVRTASPRTRIILQSVFPVASNERAWTSVTPRELNACIDRVNQWVRELSAEYQDVRYLDTQSVLRDEDGFLKQVYEAGDGVHLSAQGYRAILSYICTHAWTE